MSGRGAVHLRGRRLQTAPPADRAERRLPQGLTAPAAEGAEESRGEEGGTDEGLGETEAAALLLVLGGDTLVPRPAGVVGGPLLGNADLRGVGITVSVAVGTSALVLSLLMVAGLGVLGDLLLDLR